MKTGAKRAAATLAGAAIGLAAFSATTIAQDYADKGETAYEENGRKFTDDDVPTYDIAADGTVDWPVFSGFRRYHSECHVCHGPDGEGSSYAPALKTSVLNMDYYDFVAVVAAGIKKVGAAENSVMPAFGDNRNVMCYMEDIYVYLKARGRDELDRGRPAKREAKSDAFSQAEVACMEG